MFFLCFQNGWACPLCSPPSPLCATTTEPNEGSRESGRVRKYRSRLPSCISSTLLPAYSSSSPSPSPPPSVASPMADYLAWDRPSPAPTRYEHGIDAKIVVMGNTGPSSHSQWPPQIPIRCPHIGVGKTSLLHRYTQNKFDPRNVTSTTGAFFVTKKVYVDGLKVRLQLWDTAGQERFRSMVSLFLPYLLHLKPPRR